MTLEQASREVGVFCDTIIATDGISVIRTPFQAPPANAYLDRWIGAARRECLDPTLILGRRQLTHVLGVYARHYEHRAHRALDLRPPDQCTDSFPTAAAPVTLARSIGRHDLLGGLIHEYQAAASNRKSAADTRASTPRALALTL